MATYRPDMAIAEMLRARFDELQPMTQEEAAQACGVKQSSFNRWLNSKAAPKPEHVEAVARYLDTDPAIVLAGVQNYRLSPSPIAAYEPPLREMSIEELTRSLKDAGVSVADVEEFSIDVERHLYSVPHALVHQEVEARLNADTIEILVGRKSVALHPRSYVRGAFTTTVAHMPSAHRAQAEWTPSRILAWAEKVGPATRALCDAILKDRPHPEQGFRSCLGILRLARRDGDARLEAAAVRALQVGVRSYRHVDSILKRGLDRVPLHDADAPSSPVLLHENIRGPRAYH